MYLICTVSRKLYLEIKMIIFVIKIKLLRQGHYGYIEEKMTRIKLKCGT